MSTNGVNLNNYSFLLGSNSNPIMQLLSVERSRQLSMYETPLGQLQSQQQSLSTQQSEWEKISGLLSKLSSSLSTLQSSTPFQATMASSSAATVVSVSGSAASPGVYGLQVNSLATSAQDLSTNSWASSTTSLGLSGSFAINGVTISLTASTGLAGVAQDINNANANVTANVIATTGASSSSTSYYLEITATQTDQPISYSASTVLYDLGITASSSTTALATGVQVTAPNAAAVSLSIGSRVLNLTSPSNTDTSNIPGLTLALKGTGTTTVTVSATNQTVTNDVSNFVSAWNSLFKELHSASNPYYNPGLSTNTIQPGVLQGDPNIALIEQELGTALNTTLISTTASTGGTTLTSYENLANIGITMNTDGTLSVGAAYPGGPTLQSVSQTSMGLIQTLFNSTGGVGMNLKSTLASLVGSSSSSFASMMTSMNNTFNSQITQIQNQEQNLQQMMTMVNNNLNSQFSSYLQLISKYQMQNQYVSGLVNALSNQSTSGSSTSGG